MLQNLTKGKMVEWVILLIALVALGLSIAAIVKPCKSNFVGTCISSNINNHNINLQDDVYDIPCQEEIDKIDCVEKCLDPGPKTCGKDGDIGCADGTGSRLCCDDYSCIKNADFPLGVCTKNTAPRSLCLYENF